MIIRLVSVYNQCVPVLLKGLNRHCSRRCRESYNTMSELVVSANICKYQLQNDTYIYNDFKIYITYINAQN